MRVATGALIRATVVAPKSSTCRMQATCSSASAEMIIATQVVVGDLLLPLLRRGIERGAARRGLAAGLGGPREGRPFLGAGLFGQSCLRPAALGDAWHRGSAPPARDRRGAPMEWVVCKTGGSFHHLMSYSHRWKLGCFRADARIRTAETLHDESSLALDSTRRFGARQRTKAAIGTFTNRAHSQPAHWVRTPPRSTPAATPAPATAPQMPRARFRSEPSEKVVVAVESAAGEAIAAPSPWTARTMISLDHSAVLQEIRQEREELPHKP